MRSFAENRIDLSILPDLTDQDLKDLGIGSERCIQSPSTVEWPEASQVSL